MSEIICTINAKGGVGKTTISINMAGALSQFNKKILMIDLDPQANASSGLGIRDPKIDVSCLFRGVNTFDEVKVVSPCDNNIDVIPSNPNMMYGIEAYLSSKEMAEFTLIQAIEEHLDSYDYIIIDSPPNLGKLTGNALLAANSYIVPLVPEPFAIDGIGQINLFVSRIKKINKDLKFKGYLINRYNEFKKNSTYEAIVNKINETGFRIKAYIREDGNLYKDITHGQHIFKFTENNKIQSNGCVDFINVCKEIFNLN